MRMTLTQRLERLRNRMARAQTNRKAAEPIHREMVRLVVRQLRREIRDDRRKQA